MIVTDKLKIQLHSAASAVAGIGAGKGKGVASWRRVRLGGCALNLLLLLLVLLPVWPRQTVWERRFSLMVRPISITGHGSLTFFSGGEELLRTL